MVWKAAPGKTAKLRVKLMPPQNQQLFFLFRLFAIRKMSSVPFLILDESGIPVPLSPENVLVRLNKNSLNAEPVTDGFWIARIPAQKV